ncbi:hypothetical protein ADUPG1_007400 [Aduncisulcus paluster]|uniref:Uncharacterized protein n=1 Tax=Aduncisulcus paluster TaxID=2918883 RepID=A0ABQ5KPQ9_9EUKA|nr:hypothetical protein ADUPG1_007400 [Aduncisulcus paluster]
MGFDQALLPHLAPALKARTVLNMFLTHRLSTEELKTELLPSSLAHNAHYMQAACDMGVCIWFLSLEDKHLAIYNSPADGLARRVYMGWHEKHVRPVFFKRALPVGQMAAKGWEVDMVQTWRCPGEFVGAIGSTPKEVYKLVTDRTGLVCMYDVRKTPSRKPLIAYLRCRECKATLATVKHNKESRKWYLAKADLDHKPACSLYSPEHCTISSSESE